jgi:dipeptidase E
MTSRRDFLLAAATTAVGPSSAVALSGEKPTEHAKSPSDKRGKRQIFAMDSGFLEIEPWAPPVLQNYLLSLTGKAEPRICLLATASGDSPAIVEMFYRVMANHPCRARHLNMFAPCTSDFPGFLTDHDVIYVAGGATKNLMSLWRDWKLDEALRVAWDAGVILSGESAGMVCWFESCITDSLPERLLPLGCLGLLKGSACPHYDARPEVPPQVNRQTVFRSHIATGDIPSPGIATGSRTALHYIEDQLVDVVSDRKGAHAYKVERVPEGYRETPIDARYIGA